MNPLVYDMNPSVVKPGQIRILNALSKGKPLGNVELAVSANLVNSTIRSRYLREMRKMGLITKDIDTRKYSIADRGCEMLRLVEELRGFEDRMRIFLEEGIKQFKPS